jgi:hypothetical protein
MSPEAAASKFHMSGVSSSELVQSLESLQKSHGVYAADEASATGPDHFARNMNAYCLSSGTNKSGADGVSILAASAKTELSSIATDITQQDLTIGGVPGVETSYKTDTSSGTLSGSQLEVLPAAGRVCFVTLTVSKSESPGTYLDTAASTAKFF